MGINTSDTMDGWAGTAGNPTARRSWDKEPSAANSVSILAWVSLGCADLRSRVSAVLGECGWECQETPFGDGMLEIWLF